MADRRVEIDVVANNRASSELDQIGGSADRADSRSKRLLGSLGAFAGGAIIGGVVRSEEHTSELQSLPNLACRLLLEKKELLNKRKRSS